MIKERSDFLITTISVVCGLIMISIITIFTRKKVLVDCIEHKNETGYYVMRLKSLNKVMVFFCFFTSLIAFVSIALAHSSMTFEETVSILCIGVFFSFLSIFFVLMLKYERIEYNDSEICQYRLFRKKHTTIQWKDITNVNFVKIGPLLELKSATGKIYIDFRCNGISYCLKFIETKLIGANKANVTNILKSMN